MLDLMRKHARNWIMKVLLGIIIIVFVFYFGSIGGKQQAETIATVDGKAIAYVDFAKEYQNLIQAYRQRLGPAFNDDALRQLNLKQVAMDNLIQQEIIMQKAKEKGLMISDEEVRMSIMAMPAFQREGVFDEKIYQQALRFYKITPEDFERMQKNGLIASIYMSLIQEGVKISDQDVYDLYRFQKEKVNILFLQVSADAYRANITPKDDELEAYLKENSQAFRVPDRIQVKYILFKGDDFAQAVKVTDAEIADYYDRQTDQFKTKDGKRQPLAEVRNKIAEQIRRFGAMQAAADAARLAHNTIYQEEDFEGYAAKNRLSIKTTGLFGADSVPAELRGIADAVPTLFSLNKDEISKVISDQHGYYLFKLADKKPAYTPALEEVRKQVEQRVIAREALRLARQGAEAMLAALKQGKPLQEIAQQYKIKIEETGFFSAGEGSAKLGDSQEIKAAVFQMGEKNPLPERVFPANGKYIVMQFKERTKPDDSDFAARRDILKRTLLQMTAGEVMKSWMEATKATMIKEGRLKINKDIKDL